MKKRTFRRVFAGIAACAMMAAAMPAANLSTAFAAKNIVSNPTFDTGTSGWAIYKESGGAATLSVENGKLAVHITDQGKVNYAVQPNYDIVRLYKGGVYRFSYEISSTVPRYVESMIQKNKDDYSAYTWKGVHVTTEPQVIDYQFTMEDETDFASKMCWNCGIQQKEDGGSVGEHTIYLDNVTLELIDDSNVDYSESKPYEADIMTNQVGYRTDAVKTAVFRNTDAVSFNVVNADTKQIVRTFQTSAPVSYSPADENDCVGDFSEITAPGNYYITAEGMDDSYPFTIGDDVYDKLNDDAVRMLYLQRCGTEVVDGTFGHPACHNTMATIYHTSEKLDVTGGWHDAGDYGRYPVAAAKAVADLLYAYNSAPDMFGDSIGIPESGNGTPDILDEVRYELEWLLKMQRADGAVYHKVTCATFPGTVMPQSEKNELIIMPPSTTATADFAASMALAYEIYKNVDAAFADTCLEAAKRAYTWAKANPGELYTANPADISTGAYEDRITADELYWASAQMFRATGDASYMDGMTAKSGIDWSTVGDYGNIAIVSMDGIDKESQIYKDAAAMITKQASTMKSISDASPYGVAINKFNWGSNMTIANAGIIMAYASELTGDPTYMEAARDQIHYILGVNPLGYSFVTGYGTVAAEHPHHRPSQYLGKTVPAMVVGGVNSGLEDSIAKAYLQDNPPAKCWLDDDASYSVNEVTIYWNSPFTYLMALTGDSNGNVQPPVSERLWGDANCDGVVDIADATKILQCIGNGDKYKLTEKGLLNADVYENGSGITAMDALSVQKYDAKVIDKLPESYKENPDPAVTTIVTESAVTTAATQPVVPETTTEPAHPANGITDYGTPMRAGATAVEDFRDGESTLFFASDGWTNGSCFDCGWYAQNTSLENGMLSLTIDKDHSGKYNYSGAEYRTSDHYGYGYYETSMQAIKNDGVVSSFFTYTGPSEDNPWDEIDIEILGKDTTKVQLNYYTNGVGNHEVMYDLGFDASEGFHTYGFDWQADHITWYIDGKAVYTAYSNIPVTPGRIMMNTWPGITVDEWLKPFNGNTPLTAHYQWVTYDKAGF